jgi:hypothetical protein
VRDQPRSPSRKAVMKTHIEKCILALTLVCLAPGAGISQQKTGTSDTSLGDIARQLKAQKPKAAKPAYVFTNDNLTPASPASTITGTPPDKKPTDETSPKDKKKTGAAHDETYYRAKLSELKDNLDMHTRELEVQQQKLGQNQTQYYPDPNKTLQQEYSRKDINTLGKDIEEKKQQIADDQKAIDDLHEQLRQESGDPAWLR